MYGICKLNSLMIMIMYHWYKISTHWYRSGVLPHTGYLMHDYITWRYTHIESHFIAVDPRDFKALHILNSFF